MTFDPAGLKPKKLEPRPKLGIDKIRRDVWTNGLDVRWEKACRCPCDTQVDAPGTTDSIVEFTSEQDHDCLACAGKGWVWHSAQTIRAIVLSAAKEPEKFAPYGHLSQGMVRITTLPEHWVDVPDRFTILDALHRYSETRVRAGAVESLRYPIVSATITHGTDADPTVETTTDVAVVHALAADATGEIVADGGVPRVYSEGTHFEVNGSGQIDWSIGDAAGTAPAVGQRYAIDYFCRPVYIAQNVPYVHRFTRHKHKSPVETLEALEHRVDCRLESLGAP